MDLYASEGDSEHFREAVRIASQRLATPLILKSPQEDLESPILKLSRAKVTIALIHSRLGNNIKFVTLDA